MTEKQGEVSYGFAHEYGVTLYFEHAVEPDFDSLKETLSKHIGEVSLATKGEQEVSYGFRGSQLIGEAKVEVLGYHLQVHNHGPDESLLDAYLNQTWNWQEAKDLKGRIVSSIVMTDDIGNQIPYQKRLVLFQLVLYRVVETLKPIGIQWHASGQLVDPEAYINNVPGNEDYDLLFGPLNVRFYSIEQEEGSTLMDTLGMAALGVVDMQCYFSGFEVEGVADVLYDYGAYVFWNGDVIQDGDTIESYEVYKKWGCRHEISQLEPRRPVLNIGPDVKV